MVFRADDSRKGSHPLLVRTTTYTINSLLVLTASFTLDATLERFTNDTCTHGSGINISTWNKMDFFSIIIFGAPADTWNHSRALFFGLAAFFSGALFNLA